LTLVAWRGELGSEYGPECKLHIRASFGASVLAVGGPDVSFCPVTEGLEWVVPVPGRKVRFLGINPALADGLSEPCYFPKMNLLQAFEGLSGEVLGTAALRVILLDNPAVRDEVIDLLSDASITGPLLSNAHFACYRELGTSDESGQSGRLDLLLELDNSVIGIEAKFFAAIQPQQPTKYLATLRQRAELLSTLRGTAESVLPQLFLLAPEANRANYREFLPHASFISWESVASVVERATLRNEGSRTLERDFVAFVRGKLDFLPRLSRELPHLTRAWQPNGSELQCSFLRSVYFDALGLRGGKISRGGQWCGYYLARTNDVWLGIGPSEDPARPGSARVLLASLHDLALPEPTFRRESPTRTTTFSIKNRFVPAQFHWLVDVTLAWKDPVFVRQLFAPVLARAAGSNAEVSEFDADDGRTLSAT
jgi:hypothetical protein